MIEPGIYFGMDEATYHADPSLGSSDLKRLLAGPAEYWFGSTLNPSHKPDDGEAAHLRFGRAVHKIVLEGEQAFAALYERAPDRGPDLLVTVADITRWLTELHGVTKVPRSKPECMALALSLDPTVKILEAIEARAQAEGRTILPADEHDRIVAAAAAIAGNEDLATAFQGGAAEVSIFWQVDVADRIVPLKARFDYLKVRGIGDLKSIGNTKGLGFADACRRQIAGFRYDVQAEHYLTARGELPRLVAAGAVHGDHDPAWLNRVADQAEFGWAWVFFHSGEAPMTWAASLSPGNPILEIARSDIDRALLVYARFMDVYGPDQPWLIPATVSELDLAELPSWYGRVAA